MINTTSQKSSGTALLAILSTDIHITSDDGSQVHLMLRIHDGFACRACPRTINYDEVYLQTWTHGSSRKYWTVKKNGSIIRLVAGWGVGEHMQQLQQRVIQRTEEQERTHSTNITTPTLAGTPPWIERTRWEIIYQGFRRDILRSFTEMPCSPPRTDHVLGQRSNPADLELVSPQVDEARVALLMVAVDHMVDRWEDTMRHTGRTILCWLKSTKPQTCYPKPFTLVALQSSEKKYRQLLERFLAFVFRASRMSVDARHRLTGIRFKREQLRQMRALWEHAAWSDADLSQGRWPGSRDGEENVGGDIEDEGEGEDNPETDEGEDNDDEDAEGDAEEGERDDSENNKSEDDEQSVGYGSEDEYQQRSRDSLELRSDNWRD
ncbi:hypothetical protein VE03_10692 [Pseudogymnoascus sp. 23342-1-I1]|nr:hypothetical protein VE03_10692 [Pseudogymnoascus sp. 23342-1-I1]